LQYESLNIPLIALPYLLLFLLGISELSDAFDGYIARKYNQVTDFGKLFDPMADSIYRTSVFLTFTLPPISLPVFIIFVFIYRDSVISTLRTICALKGYALAARPSGKIKAVVQAAASISILLLFIPYTLGTLHAEALQRNSMLIAGGAAAYAFLSGLDYLYANRDYILKLLTTQKNAIEIRDQ
jgi:CDP-diacylglycerol--glycerol-3-phosphate 3-phosphatidyltransferase